MSRPRWQAFAELDSRKDAVRGLFAINRRTGDDDPRAASWQPTERMARLWMAASKAEPLQRAAAGGDGTE